MDYDESQTVSIAYIASNIAGLILLWVTYKNTKLARLLFAILFAWASCMNLTMAWNTPEAYLDYSKTSVGIYATFINGWFRENIMPFVTTVTVAQGLIAIGCCCLDEGFNFGNWRNYIFDVYCSIGSVRSFSLFHYSFSRGIFHNKKGRQTVFGNSLCKKTFSGALIME